MYRTDLAGWIAILHRRDDDASNGMEERKGGEGERRAEQQAVGLYRHLCSMRRKHGAVSRSLAKDGEKEQKRGEEGLMEGKKDSVTALYCVCCEHSPSGVCSRVK